MHNIDRALTYAALFTLISVVETVMLFSSFVIESDATLIFIWLELFNLSIMTMSLAASTCFNSAKIASMVGPVLIFVTVLPRYIFFGTYDYASHKS